MTKHVRIENADNSNFKVLVEVWDKGQNGQPDTLAHSVTLGHRTAMTAEGSVYLTSTRYIVVKELPATP